MCLEALEGGEHAPFHRTPQQACVLGGGTSSQQLLPLPQQLLDPPVALGAPQGARAAGASPALCHQPQENLLAALIGEPPASRRPPGILGGVTTGPQREAASLRRPLRRPPPVPSPALE